MFTTSENQERRETIAIEGGAVVIEWIRNSNEQSQITRWFGCKEFLVVTPPVGKVFDQSAATMMLSALFIAANASRLSIPCLVAMGKGYIGRWKTSDGILRLNVDTMHASMKYLSDVVALFESKLDINKYDPAAPPIFVAVKMTYNLVNAWRYKDWSVAARALELPAGSAFPGFWSSDRVNDPLLGLSLGASWPKVPEGALNDNPSYTDLDPRRAPTWVLQSIDDPSYTPALTLFLGSIKEAMVQAERFRVAHDAFNPAMALGTGPMPSAHTIDRILRVLFDSDPNAYREAFIDPPENDLASKGQAHHGGFLEALALHMASLTGARQMMLLWAKVVDELRWYWEQGVDIPGVRGEINHTHSLLQQKIDLLQICIREKRSRSNNSSSSRSASDADSRSASTTSRLSHDEDKAAEEAAEDDEDDDELEMEQDEEKLRIKSERARLKRHRKAVAQSHQQQSPQQAADPGETDSFFDAEDGTGTVAGADAAASTPLGMRRGHKEPLPGLRYLEHPDLVLYLPHLMPPVPHTSDSLEEQLRILQNLGESDASVIQRAKLQSISLQSDMRAFKAANPGCTMSDFVRWHSPRDWHSDTPDGAPHLSDRMSKPGNLWAELWNLVEPQPCSEQEGLYDVIDFGEKAVDFLNTFSATQLLGDLGGIAMGCEGVAVKRLAHATKQLNSPYLSEIFAQFMRSIETGWDALEHHLRATELLINRAISLNMKLRSPRLVEQLLRYPEATIKTDEEREVVEHVFASSDSNDRDVFLPQCDVKEMVCETVENKRIYAASSESDLRIALIAP